MSLKRIPDDIEKIICASSHINSFTKAIEELVYNSLDAESSSIAIRVFIQENTIQVIDNGLGISKKDFSLIGHKYMTSKFRKDGEQSLKYGCRGLSLSSIIDVSHTVQLTSRRDDSDETLIKRFVEGKEESIKVTSTRPSKGTTVDIKGFLHNLHIQKKSTDPTTEISLVKAFLEQVSLVHLNVSISVRDDSINEIIFKVNKNRDIFKTLLFLFEIKSQDIQELLVEKNYYKVHGFIEKSNDYQKKYNFIYINGRFILKSRLHDKMNQMLKNKFSCKVVKTKEGNFKDEKTLFHKRIPIYFIFIKCPYSDYDVIYSTNQTLVEFKNWDKIDKIMEKLISLYNGDFERKKLQTVNQDNMKDNTNTRKQVEQIMQKILGNNVTKNKGAQFGMGIKGKNVKRKQKSKIKNKSLSKIVSNKLKIKLDVNQSKKRKKNLNSLTKDINSIYLVDKILTNKSGYKIPCCETEVNVHNVENKIICLPNKNLVETFKISQDPLNRVFKNPTASVIKRCNILFDEAKRNFDNNIKLKPKHINYKHDNFNDNVTFRRKHYIVQKIKDTRIKNISISHNQINDIKTSYDLIRSVFKNQQLLENDSAKIQQEQHISNNLTKSICTNRETFDKIISYESHKYTQFILGKNKRQFISSYSRENFDTHRSQHEDTYPQLNEGRKRNHGNNNHVKQLNKKTNYDYFVNGDSFQSTYYTIDVTKSKISIQDNKEKYYTNIDKEYLSCVSMYQTFTPHIQKSSKSQNILSSADEINTTEIDLNKTYTLRVTNNRDYSNKTEDNQSNQLEANIPNPCINRNKKANIIFVSEPESLNTIVSNSLNPLNVCEIVFENNNELNDEKGYNYNPNNKGTDYSISNYDLCVSDFQKNSNNYSVFSQYFERVENRKLQSNVNRNTDNCTVKNTKTEHKAMLPENLRNEKNIEGTGNPCNLEGGIIDSDIVNSNIDYFNLNSRFSFVPKGMSQMMKNIYSKTSYHDAEEEYYQHEIYEKFANDINVHSKVLEPNVHDIKNMVTIANKNVICFNNENNDLIFNALSTREAKVLGQVDHKFIAAKVSGQSSKENVSSDFLVLFDQHAVDERIRLERNISEYFDGKEWKSVTLESLPIAVSKDLIIYLHNHKEKFTRFGLHWIIENGDVVITSIPKAILGKNARQVEVIMKAVRNLICEQIEAIKSLKGNVSLYPKSIMELVFSEACRYAIKFGDTLTKDECQNMLNALSNCKLPFQCAHGRPVMAVIMELPTLNYEYKVNTEKIKKFSQIKKLRRLF